MRTIKFRGKSRYDRRWIIGALVHNGKRPCIAEFGKLFELTEVDYESVGQFTGLSDHNGSQICRAAKTLLPPKFWKYHKGWHKESAIEGKINFYKRINETLSR